MDKMHVELQLSELHVVTYLLFKTDFFSQDLSLKLRPRIFFFPQPVIYPQKSTSKRLMTH